MTTRPLFWDVDTQVDFMHPEGRLYVPGAESLVGNLERLTRLARELEIPLLASADDHEIADDEIDPDRPDGVTTFPPHCMRHTPGAERIEATRLEHPLVLDDIERDRAEIRRGLDQPWPRVLIKKKRLDAFSNPNTEVVLDLLAPDAIVVYGVALDFCVRAVVEGLLDRGHQSLFVVTDATKAIDSGRGRELLEAWRGRGVELVTTEGLAERLVSSPTV